MKSFIILLFLISMNSYSSTKMDVQNKLNEIIKKHNIPSMSVMILDGDETLLHEYSGIRIVGEKDKINGDDLFHLGSCGKAFTASLILKLLDEKKLSLDDSITKYLKSLDSKKFSDIKIKHLLSHTAGISANPSGAHWSDMFTFDVTPTKGRDIALDFLNKDKRLSKAGAKYSYSNIGYLALGQIIESIEKDSFENVLEEKLFKPLHMNSCIFGPVGRDGKTKGPYPHELKNGKFQSINPEKVWADNPPALGPAGGISCSQKDWAKFIRFTMKTKKSHKYLSNKSHDNIFSKNLDNYTYGAWGLYERDWSKRILVHAGSNTVNYAYAIVGIDKRFAFLLNSNSDAEKPIKKMVKVLKEYYLNRKKSK